MVLNSIARFAAVATAILALAPAALAAETGEMALGNPKAKVTVVEYASVTCPHCGRFDLEVFPAFKAKYVDTGKVYYVFREFPTEPAQLAEAGFLVARCAGKDKYFAVLDALFRGQDKLYQTQDGKTWLLDAGKVGGLDEAKIQACLSDTATQQAFGERVQTAFNEAKIMATPTFIIGGKKVEGEQTLAELSAMIDPMLAAK